MEFGKVMPAIYQVRNLGARLQLPGALLSATSGKEWKQRRAAPEQLSKRALQHRTVRTSVADAPTPSAAAVGSVGALNAFGHILGNAQLPPIENETYKHYAPGSRERAALKAELEALKSQFPVRVPCVVNGKEYFDDAEPVEQVMPHDHRRVIALYRPLDGQLVQKAIQGALEARERWSRAPADERAAIFLKAAELASQKYRYRLNAATMFGQSKNVWQAEIDAAVETIDFWRFGVKYMREIYNMQPPEHFPRGVWNRLEWRPLEGFVAAISPFNFTAIGANLPSSPAIMGNVALWKPSPNTELSSWFVYQVLREAGLVPASSIQHWRVSISLGAREHSARFGNKLRATSRIIAITLALWAKPAVRIFTLCTPAQIWTGSYHIPSAEPLSTRARSALPPLDCTYRRRSGQHCVIAWFARCSRSNRAQWRISRFSCLQSSIARPSSESETTLNKLGLRHSK
jgi:hypothetical protein